jgi:hypothetical protein
MTILADESALAQALEKRGLIDATTAVTAGGAGERIAIALVRDGRVDAGLMAAALSEITATPPATLPETVDAGAISRDYLAARMIAPIRIEAGRLVVAMADPTDAEAIAGIGFATGLPVVPRVARVDDIRRAIGLDATTAPLPPKAAFRSTVVDSAGSARTVTLVAADRAAARRSLQGEGLRPVSVTHGEPSLVQRLRAHWAPGGGSEADLIERIGIARAQTRDLNAALAAVAAEPLAPARVAIDRIVARGPVDPVAAIAAEPGLPPGSAALIADAADQGETLRRIAAFMREREALHVAARAPFVPAAAWAVAAVALLLAGGAFWLAATVAVLAALAAVQVTRIVNIAIGRADTVAVATLATPSDGATVYVRLDRDARVLATRLGSTAHAGGIALFALATIVAVYR